MLRKGKFPYFGQFVIDKLKITAHKKNRSVKVRKNLEAMAQPKVWPQSDLETTTVHTPFTTRAKELLDLYNGLNLPLLSIDERLDVLLHVSSFLSLSL